MSDQEKKSTSASKSENKAKKEKEKAKAQNKFKRWVREMKSELAKVSWPSKKETSKHTITVLCCVGLVGVFIWVFDFLAANVIEALISLT